MDRKEYKRRYYKTKKGQCANQKNSYKSFISKNKKLNSKMNSLFKYQCMLNIEQTEDIYWEFKDNRIIWLVVFFKINKKEKVLNLEFDKGILDESDIPTMKLRMKECENTKELYDKYYKLYTKQSFLFVLKLTIEDIKKDRK